MEYFDVILDYVLPFKENGYKEFDSAKLYGKAVHIAPEAYCHQLYKPLNENDIDLLETEIMTSIPKVYKEFLVNKSNGLSFFVTGLSLYGLRKIPGRSLEASAQPFDLQTPNTLEKPKNSNENQFFIGSYGYDGSKIYINKNTGKVHFCRRRDANSIFEWNSFEEFMISETKRFFAFYDNKGIRLVEGKKTLPS